MLLTIQLETLNRTLKNCVVDNTRSVGLYIDLSYILRNLREKFIKVVQFSAFKM